MDALINVLNQRVSNQIAKSQSPATTAPGKQTFAEVLDSKRSDLAMDKIADQLRESKDGIKIIAADDIHLNASNIETSSSSSGFDAKEKALEMFSSMNDNMNNLESSIEVLSDPNVKLTRRQLLAYQAGIGQFSFMADVVSKGTQAAVSSIQQILNTNIG